MNELEAIIEKSQYIRDLGDNWDQEGAKCVNTLSYDRSIEFLRQSFCPNFPIPDISPAYGGNVYIYLRDNEKQVSALIYVEQDKFNWSIIKENKIVASQTDLSYPMYVLASEFQEEFKKVLE